VSLPHQDLGLVISKAREQAKELLTQLEGHPQTNESSAVYLALVTLQKRLLRVDPPPPPVARSGRSCDTPTGQHPWPAALVPFSDAERH